jgi:CheY-like chemotaxis protein
MAEPPRGQDRPEGRVRGTATVLVVEDEVSVRELEALILRELGYTVLEAASGSEALRTMQDLASEVDLALIDVVMPEMSGMELASRLEVLRPGVKVLFVSGYPTDTIVLEGELNSRATFLQKPFGGEVLARAVREALDSTGS